MPATEVSPTLRRRLSDDARQLLRSALSGSATAYRPSSTTGQSLVDRLQHFRGQIRLEVPSSSSPIRLRIAVSDSVYILRYQVERIGAEVSLLNKAGASTSWITLSDGEHIQLRSFLAAFSSPASVCEEITSVVELLETVDLFDLFKASTNATPVPTSPTAAFLTNHATYCSSTDRHRYLFLVDRNTSNPLAVTQTSNLSLLHEPVYNLVVEQYVRYDGSVDAPQGIKSDVEIMIDTAMKCFTKWSQFGQKRIVEVFGIIDKDDDGFISGQDVYHQLRVVGHADQQCSNIVMEMTRLLCDSSDPAEEFELYKFCGFWITMLADTYRVSDPVNEVTVVTAFERLFLGM